MQKIFNVVINLSYKPKTAALNFWITQLNFNYINLSKGRFSTKCWQAQFRDIGETGMGLSRNNLPHNVFIETFKIIIKQL